MMLSNSKINASTCVYGLIGYPVEHSLSPKFWNSAFDVLSLNAVYLAFPVLPEHFYVALSGLKSSAIKGLNVTRPHKRDASRFCDYLHGASYDTKIVNTIKFTENGVEGWNTDAVAFYNILTRFELSKNTALILGNGATSESVIWALKKYGLSRLNQIARNFSDEDMEENSKNNFLRKFSWNSKNFYNTVAESDIIINTTPIGWQEVDDIPELIASRNSSKCFVDFNYKKESKLLSRARQFCETVIDGREMLYEQGLEAFKILMNCEPPADVIRYSIFS